jgi:SNF2 family DNA or RNA helicase
MQKISKILYPKYATRKTYNDLDVKDFFPQAVFQTHIINLSTKNEKAQNKLYKETMLKVKEYTDLGKQAEKMVAELRYRQAAELFKADVLAEIATDYIAEGKSVIIFVNFKETLAALSKMLNTKSLIFGAQEAYKLNREKIIHDFQTNSVPIILAMVDAGGTSISLHDTIGSRQRISLICPTYNPITLKQVMGRTYRAGSKTTPIIKLVYAGNTIEEKVASTVNMKLSNISALVDGDLMEPDFFNLIRE